ncbi:MAG TPA: 30S ribosomal protein S16 [Bacteroidia bacterium]|jgi:small subunit ribosomal protein S16
MPVKIRLQRHGKKGQAFFHIVVADGRAPRDGKFIEKIGTYDPKTNPATINIEFDKAIDWLQKGAQTTDTTKAILSYKGVMYKNHLLKGVAKGALKKEDAEAKFEKWLNEKNSKIEGKKNTLATAKSDHYKKRMEAEEATKKSKAEKIAAKQAAAAEAKTQAPATETPAAEEQPKTE